MPDVIVVGAGIWGSASVEAYHKSGRSVIWIDDNEEHATAASVDIARIIRAEYSDPAYRELAMQSLEAFRTKEPYSKFFHETGWILVQEQRESQHGSIPSGTQVVSREEFQQQFPATHIDDDLLVTRSENVGWVEADKLLQDLNNNIGVERRTGTVTGLIFDGSLCRGVRLGEEDLLGETVVLATGWRGNELLARHNLTQVEYQTVGVSVLGIQLNEEQYVKYQHSPILCDPKRGEILPPTMQRIMRINNPRSFTFNDHSVPTNLVPTHACFKESWAFLETYFPDLIDCPAVISSICCDAFTKSQSFCIQKVPGARNICYVGGGSFHSWKFRPILSGLVAARLGLKGEDNEQKLWEALSQEKSKKHAGLVPTRSFLSLTSQG